LVKFLVKQIASDADTTHGAELDALLHNFDRSAS